MNVAAGDPIPALTVTAVDPEKMKIMAALLRDPNPIHFDPEAARSAARSAARAAGPSAVPSAARAMARPAARPAGTVNQGPVNIGYVQNMLAAWAGGEERLRTLSLRLTANVLAGDRVVASGQVTRVGPGAIAECDVWLDVVSRAGQALTPPVRALTGTAVILLAGGAEDNSPQQLPNDRQAM